MNILIVDDHLLFAEVLALALESEASSVVKATTGKAAYSIIEETALDLVLLDMNLPDTHGEVILVDIKEKFPHLRVIIVSADNLDNARIKTLGADGYINKTANIETMLSAIKNVIAGQEHFESRDIETPEQGGYSISPRQLEIVSAMARGQANKQIAHGLNISEGTVKQQINRIFRVLDVKNRTQCIRKAQQLGLLLAS